MLWLKPHELLSYDSHLAVYVLLAYTGPAYSGRLSPELGLQALPLCRMPINAVSRLVDSWWTAALLLCVNIVSDSRYDHVNSRVLAQQCVYQIIHSLHFVWFILRPCQHDNGYIDGIGHRLKTHRRTDPGSQRPVFAGWSSIQVLTEVDVPQLQWTCQRASYCRHRKPSVCKLIGHESHKTYGINNRLFIVFLW